MALNLAACSLWLLRAMPTRARCNIAVRYHPNVATSACRKLHCAVQEPNNPVLFGVQQPPKSPRCTLARNPEPQQFVSSAHPLSSSEINIAGVLSDTTSTVHSQQPTKRVIFRGGKPVSGMESMWGISTEDAEAADEMRLQRKILRCLQDIPEAVAVVGSGTV